MSVLTASMPGNAPSAPLIVLTQCSQLTSGTERTVSCEIAMSECSCRNYYARSAHLHNISKSQASMYVRDARNRALDYAAGCAASASRTRPNRRSESELVTTVTEERAIAAAAKIGALSRKNGIAGDAIARGISTVL